MSNTPTKEKLKKAPLFKSENEENKFWAKAETSEYFDYKNSYKMNFPNLKYSTEKISISLSKSMLEDIKLLANKNDVPYQSLIKIFLADRISEEKAKYI